MINWGDQWGSGPAPEVKKKKLAKQWIECYCCDGAGIVEFDKSECEGCLGEGRVYSAPPRPTLSYDMARSKRDGHMRKPKMRMMHQRGKVEPKMMSDDIGVRYE